METFSRHRVGYTVMLTFLYSQVPVCPLVFSPLCIFLWWFCTPFATHSSSTVRLKLESLAKSEKRRGENCRSHGDQPPFGVWFLFDSFNWGECHNQCFALDAETDDLLLVLLEPKRFVGRYKTIHTRTRTPTHTWILKSAQTARFPLTCWLYSVLNAPGTP